MPEGVRRSGLAVLEPWQSYDWGEEYENLPADASPARVADVIQARITQPIPTSLDEWSYPLRRVVDDGGEIGFETIDQRLGGGR